MPLYTCKLGSPDGKIIEKELEAATAELLRQGLEEQGYYVFELRRRPLQFLLEKGKGGGRVDRGGLLTFNQELLVLIKAGLPIVQALDTILERLEKGRLVEVLQTVREDIRGGASLSEAMEKHSSVFPYLYVASVRAGEKTGDLPHNLRRYSGYLKRAETLRKRVISAMIYPSILVTVATTVIAFLMVFAIPKFSQVFLDAGAQLPLPTQVLIAFADFLRRYILVIIAVVILSTLAYRRWAATEGGRYRIDQVKLKLPFIGDLWHRYSIANFTRTLANLLASGITVVAALRMAAGTLNNRGLERRLLQAVVRVEEGTRLSAALDSAQMMPPLALRMLSVGETTGSLEEMLNDISDYFEEEVEGRLTILTNAIEPAIMIVMGLVIAFIVITMYLPVLKFGSAIG
ncbi:MAG TPA: type II secretion system F family protein [Geobacterales bacterium]|nr:type II secretion system F family protein [Geobacterales bacterium]